jgi:hypothetical protein
MHRENVNVKTARRRGMISTQRPQAVVSSPGGFVSCRAGGPLSSGPEGFLFRPAEGRQLRVFIV